MVDQETLRSTPSLIPHIWSIKKSRWLHFQNVSRIWPLLITCACCQTGLVTIINLDYCKSPLASSLVPFSLLRTQQWSLKSHARICHSSAPKSFSFSRKAQVLPIACKALHNPPTTPFPYVSPPSCDFPALPSSGRRRLFRHKEVHLPPRLCADPLLFLEVSLQISPWVYSHLLQVCAPIWPSQYLLYLKLQLCWTSHSLTQLHFPPYLYQFTTAAQFSYTSCLFPVNLPPRWSVGSGMAGILCLCVLI